MQTRIPTRGRPKEDIYRDLEAFGENDLDPRGGRVWAYVYDTGRPEVEEIAKHAYMRYLSENALDPTVYPSCLRLETDVVRMSRHHLRGDDAVVGHFTTGGTESCMLAVKAARDFVRQHKQGIAEPEVLLPVTAHAAFHKACDFMGLKKVLVPVHPETYKADVATMREAITPNTILMVGSAVSYAHGVIDPIPELGRLALEKDILLHVDGCIGGFLLPYFRRLGAPVTDFDFTVPGVTSISMDFHKYGYCPKGASVVLYKNAELRKHQLWACAQWTGYTVINPTIQSTKSGGSLAACWAVINFLGDDGYMEIARRTLEATRRLIAGIAEIEGIAVMGRPESSLVAFSSEEINVFHIIDEMKERGWYIQPQFGFHGSKENVHLSVTAVSLERVDQLLEDLREAVEAARKLTEAEEPSALTSLFADLDASTFTPEAFQKMLASVGMVGTELPRRLAGINTIMNALPAEVTEQVLIEYFNQLYVKDCVRMIVADVAEGVARAGRWGEGQEA